MMAMGGPKCLVCSAQCASNNCLLNNNITIENLKSQSYTKSLDRLYYASMVLQVCAKTKKIPSTKTTVSSSTFVCLFHRFSLPNHLEYTRSLLASIPCRAIRIHTRFGRELSSASLCRLSRLVPDESHEGEKSPWISTLDGK